MTEYRFRPNRRVALKLAGAASLAPLFAPVFEAPP